jgi:hypothetical protein
VGKERERGWRGGGGVQKIRWREGPREGGERGHCRCVVVVLARIRMRRKEMTKGYGPDGLGPRVGSKGEEGRWAGERVRA